MWICFCADSGYVGVMGWSVVWCIGLNVIGLCSYCGLLLCVLWGRCSAGFGYCLLFSLRVGWLVSSVDVAVYAV